jgi:hypothetical protein
MSAGGVVFDERDIGTLTRVPELLAQPQGADPEGLGWEPLSLPEVQQYLESLSERRGLLGNVGIGARQTAQGLVGGIGRGLEMAGAEGLGSAFVAAGEAVGPDEFDQQRSALIRENNTLFENILDAAGQGSVSFVTSIVGGGLGGLAVKGGARALGMTASRGAMTAGTFTGSAATIFPMELESSYQAALQGGYDVNSAQVNQEMLQAAFAKTIAQTLAPAMIARGFSARFLGEIDDVGRRVATNALQRAAGSRVGQGVGVGLTEAFAEGLAEIIDRTSFDPEFRRQLNASDWKAIGPYVVEKYGEDALIAMGAGFLLGGGIGTIAARPGAVASQDGPQDLLANPPGGAPPAGPEQGELFSDLPIQRAPTTGDLAPPVEPTPVAGLQTEMDFGAEQLGLFTPMAQPTPAGLPTQPAPIGEPTGEQLSLALAPPAIPRDAARRGDALRQRIDAQRTPFQFTPPPRAMGYTDGQAEMFLPGTMGEPAAAAARVQGQVPPGAQRLRRDTDLLPPTLPLTSSEAQLDLPLPQPAATGRPFADQLNRLQQMRAQQAAAQAAAQTSAARGAEFEAAQEQAVQQREEELLRSGADLQADAIVAWDQLRPNVRDTEVTFEVLTDAAQGQWAEAVRTGKADEKLYNTLKGKADPKKVRRRKAQAEALAEARATLAQRGRLSDLYMRMMDAQERILINELQRRRAGTEAQPAAPKRRKPSAQQVALTGRYKSLTPQQKAAVRTELGVTNAAGVAEAIATRPNDVEAAINNATTPPTTPTPTRRGRKPGEPKKETPSAVQKPSPAPRPLRQGPKARQEVREQDAQRQEAPRTPTLQERVDALSDADLLTVQRRLEAVGEADIDTAVTTSPDAVEAALSSLRRAAPARRSAEEIEATRQREAAAREAAAQRAPTPPVVAPPPATVAEGATPAEALWSELRSGFRRPDLVPEYADITLEAQAAWDKASGTKKFRARTDEYKRAQLQKVLDDDLALQRGPVSGINSLTKDPDEALEADAAIELADMIEGFNDSVVEGRDPYKDADMTEAQFNARFKELADVVRETSPKARVGGPRTPLLTTFLKADGTPNVTKTGTMQSTGAFSLVDFTSGRDAVDLDNKPLKPMASGQAKLIVTKFLSRFAVKPNVSYFADQADLKRKAPELYQKAVAARPQGDFDTANAAAYFFDGNNVIIFTDRIVTADQLRTAIAHEALGHMGIRAVIPEGQVTATMDMLYNSDEGLARIVDERVAALGQSRAEATEEYLSDMAARIDGNILARWWDAIKDALNKLGLRFRDDEARYLLGQARRYLRTGERSSFFDPVRMANGAIEMNLGSDPDGNGRFTLAAQQQSGPLDTSRIAADSVYAAQARPTNVYEAAQNLRDLARGRGDIAATARDMWDKFKANAFVPTQWRAQLNEGFSRVFGLVRERYQIATTQIVEFQNMRRTPLAPRAELPNGAPIDPRSKAISSAGLAKVGSALAANRIAKSFNYRLPRDLRNQRLFTFDAVSGTYSRNNNLFNTLKRQARFTREEFAKGVEVTIEQAMPMNDAFRAKLAEERDGLLAGLTDQKEIDRITAEYDALMKAKDYMGESTRVEKLTFTDVEWRAFNEELDTMAEAEMRRLESVLTRYNEERQNTFEILKRSMKEPMTQGDRAFIDGMVQQYYEIAYGNVDYNEAGMRIASSLDVARAEKFAETLNKVILDAEKIDALFGPDGFLADSTRDTVAEQIKGLKSRLSLPKKSGDTTLDQARFVVQNQVKQLANELIATTDAERSSMRNLSTGYVPFIREGEFQVSMVAVDDAGKTYQMPEQYRQQMLYMQFGTRAEAQAASRQVAELFGDTKFELRVYDPSADEGRGNTVTKRLKLIPKVGAVKEAATTDPELNLNESIRFLRRFSINLTPSKTEDVIVALMNQNDRALKRRLQASFTPGQSRDMTKAVSQHLETLASVIARNKTAVRLANTLDIASESSPANELWFGSQAKYDQLKAKYERLKATPGANPDQLSIAEQEFTRYHSWFVTNNSGENGMRFYNESRRLLNFLDQQKSVMETDIAAGAVASQARFFTSVALLGGSLATGFLNIFGLATNVPAALATRNAAGFGGGFGAGVSITTLLQTYRAVGAPGLVPGSRLGEADYYKGLSDAQLKKMGMTRNEAEFLAEGVERGDFRAAQYDALRGTARGNITSGTAQATLDAWMFWFNATEQSTRRASGLAAYRLEYRRRKNAGQAEGEADAAAKKFAYDIVNSTLGDYTTANRPAFFRGGLQQFMFMFKQFPVNSAVLLKALPWKGRAMMGLSLLLLSGLRGLPFAEDLEDLTDTVMQKLGLKTASVRAWGIKELDKIVPGLGQFVVSGAANRYLPGDLGVRTALGDIIPGTSIGLAGADVTRELMQLFGPLASTAQSTLATLDNVISAANPNTPGSWGTVLRNTPFTMVNAWSDAYAYAQNGAVVDKRGYVVSRDYDASTILARIMGFYPRAASDQYEAIRMARRVSDYQREISVGYRDAAVRAIVQGDRAEARRIFEAVRQWNQSARGSGLEIQNFGDRVQRAVKAQRLLASERLLNASPISARARMREIMESLGTY